jgi:hypothetical protein
MSVTKYTPVEFSAGDRVCYMDENGVLEAPGTVLEYFAHNDEYLVTWDDGTANWFSEDYLCFVTPVCECGNRRRLCHPDA